MANNGEQYGSRTDAYGNPVLSQTDEYGRTGTVTGTGGLGGGPHFSTDTDTHGQQHRRTSSNSSSSSEDDGEGGRRKKKIGITEKIKEKLTGGQTMDQDQDQHQQASTTCTPAAGSGREGSYEGAEEGEQLEAGHEKKGMMDMIKEKLPGGGHH